MLAISTAKVAGCAEFSSGLSPASSSSHTRMAVGKNSWLSLKIKQIMYKEGEDTLPGLHSLGQAPLPAEREAYYQAPVLILPSPLTYWSWKERPKHYIEVFKPYVNRKVGEITKTPTNNKPGVYYHLAAFWVTWQQVFKLLEVARGFWI